MEYIQIYYKIPAKQVIKGLQRAQAQNEISQETKYRKSVIEHYQQFRLASTLDAYIERFNRTLREQFFDAYQYDLTDIKNEEQDLDDYLNWYNRQKVHEGLNWLTPFDFTRRFLKSVA
jgi:transposase InsO family protein